MGAVRCPAHTPGTAGAPRQSSAARESHFMGLMTAFMMLSTVMWMLQDCDLGCTNNHDRFPAAGCCCTSHGAGTDASEQTRELMPYVSVAGGGAPLESVAWVVHHPWSAIRRTRGSTWHRDFLCSAVGLKPFTE